jgi:plastocyanin
MNHHRLIIPLLVLAFLASAAQAQQTHVVTLNILPVDGRPVPEFYFEPVGLFIQPGDTVSFAAGSPHPKVTSYHELQGKEHRVPDGVEPFSSHVIPIGESWEYTFSVPGEEAKAIAERH